MLFLYIDVDECSLDLHDCGNNSNCINDAGSYLCECKKGFSGDGKICEGMFFFYSFA